MTETAPARHPFEPRFDGQGCRHLTYVEHRAVECAQPPDAPAHTGTRPAPPELDFPSPPCSMCGKETYHDGDGYRCDDCGAGWYGKGNGTGVWDDPNLPVCRSTHTPFDRPDLAPENESIRHFVEHCILPLGHIDADPAQPRHRADEFSTWSDDPEETR